MVYGWYYISYDLILFSLTIRLSFIIILKRILKKLGVWLWNEFSWFKIGSNDGSCESDNEQSLHNKRRNVTNS
jgi:hypothetical protein